MRVFMIVLIMALALAVHASANPTPLAAIMVRPVSTVPAASVTLGDLATLVCADQALADKLKSIPICPSPFPGKSRLLMRDQILIAMRRDGIADGSVEVLCPAQVAVTRSSSRVSGEALFEAVRQFALNAGSWPGTATAEPVRLPDDQFAPAGKLELRPRLGAQKLRKGRNSVPVDICVDGSVYTTANVSVLVRVVAPVLVSTQTIARSAEITAASTAVQDREITALPDDIVIGPAASGEVAAVPIADGAIIRRSWITAPPVVKSGDAVTITVSGNWVRVSDKGTAVQDGRVGDRIKIRLMGDVRQVRGTVAGPGRVEIRM